MIFPAIPGRLDPFPMPWVRSWTLLKAFALFILTALALLGDGSQTDFSADVCVYGGTSAGIAAALAAAREGSSVILIEPTTHLGGMSASGIGLADRGKESTIGGIAREFYEGAGAMYGKEIAWRIEPDVAAGVFRRMLAAEPNIKIALGSRLVSAQVSSRRIENLLLANGCRVSAEVFVDASYEGDLMAAAGVSYFVGRESRDAYGESLAGVRTRTPKHQFVDFVDPYVVKGLSSSGLLPGIMPEPMGRPGDGDGSVQAYTYRLCVTKAANRVPIEKPDDYDPANYELVARHVASLRSAGKKVRMRDLVQLDALPNGKFDLNNRGPISTDLIGGSSDYPNATAVQRQVIAKRHENYIRGLFTYLCTEPRLPESLRREAKAFGLARDEFTETNNWPPQLYVREARRMVGAYVVTQRDLEQSASTSTSIGMASYMIDSHNCRRVVVNRRVVNEGDLQIQTAGPFAIPYEAITPKSSECRNLLVPVCLSASHVAFSSIRMEPVFMVLGQSAGVAAAMAARGNHDVQELGVRTLQDKLRSQGQILDKPAKIDRR